MDIISEIHQSLKFSHCPYKFASELGGAKLFRIGFCGENECIIINARIYLKESHRYDIECYSANTYGSYTDPECCKAIEQFNKSHVDMTVTVRPTREIVFSTSGVFGLDSDAEQFIDDLNRVIGACDRYTEKIADATSNQVIHDNRLAFLCSLKDIIYNYDFEGYPDLTSELNKLENRIIQEMKLSNKKKQLDELDRQDIDILIWFSRPSMHIKEKYIRALIKARIEACMLADKLTDCEIMSDDQIFKLMKRLRIPQETRERIIRSCIDSLPYDDDVKEDFLYEYIPLSNDKYQSMLIFEYEGIVEFERGKGEKYIFKYLKCE